MGSLALALGCGDPPQAPAEDTSARRVVSCSPEVTRLLVEFGIADAIVGADALSLREPGVGGAQDLGPGCSDAAAAARLAPALAILLASDADPGAVARIGAPGLSTLVVEPRRIDEVLAAHFRLEAALGLTGRAIPSTSRLGQNLSTAATGRWVTTPARVVWILEREPLVVVGNDGLLHEILELAGAENGFHGRSAPRFTTTPAEIVAAAPDLVLDSSEIGPPLELPAGLTLRRIPPELALVPALDLTPRVRRLHLLLYPDESGPGL